MTMRTTTGITLWIIRAAVIVQLGLGILFWTGHAITYIPVHIVVGSLLVLGLWTVAVIALVGRVRRGLAAFELVWALAMAGFGVQQATFLVGPLHWIIRVVHLLMAFSAVAVAGTLGKTILADASRSVQPSDVARDTPPVRRVS